ncbi:MAG: glycosyl transferase [Gloeomargaritaceae cyanobacterium C42_A2020_066]|nr:glycosyl transferase [Gloeomargaritaceae cyanobacterium C42_A2020_066]
MTSITPPPTRSFSLGKLAYWVVHKPKGILKTYLERDPIRRWWDEQARQEMESTAASLPPLPVFATQLPTHVHFLTGKKYWYQTCFCAYSLIQQAQVGISFVIHDDGSLTPEHCAVFRQLFPGVHIILAPEAEARLDQYLPAGRYPSLRSRYRSLALMRKLMDIHPGQRGWRLFLDSDMLFFRRPEFLLNWLSEPTIACHMVDVVESYGYTKALMSRLCEAPIPASVNTGILGIQSESIDWDRVELWCQGLLDAAGTHYYQEQALTAMILATQSCIPVSAQDYLVKPDEVEAQSPKAVLHHYVATSKPWYYHYGWRHVLATTQGH